MTEKMSLWYKIPINAGFAIAILGIVEHVSGLRLFVIPMDASLGTSLIGLLLVMTYLYVYRRNYPYYQKEKTIESTA